MRLNLWLLIYIMNSMGCDFLAHCVRCNKFILRRYSGYCRSCNEIVTVENNRLRIIEEKQREEARRKEEENRRKLQEEIRLKEEKEQREQIAKEKYAPLLLPKAKSDREFVSRMQQKSYSTEIHNQHSYHPDDFVGDNKILQFGYYFEGEDKKVAPIKWRVIEVEHDRVKLISKFVIDAAPFAIDKDMTDWEQSYLRYWLNNYFCYVAFDEDEILAISPSADNSEEAYSDKVFALNSSEISELEKGTASTIATSYAVLNGARIASYLLTYDASEWWTRTSWVENQRGLKMPRADIVSESGDVDRYYHPADIYSPYGIRPCIWIDINKLPKDLDLHIVEDASFGWFAKGDTITLHTFQLVNNVSIPPTVNDTKITALGKELFVAFKETYDEDGGPESYIETENQCLENVVIPEGITSIGDSAFMYCVNLREIKFPNTLKIIGKNAFRGCLGLQEICIPDSVIAIEDYAFAECYNLKTLRLPEKRVARVGKAVYPDISKMTIYAGEEIIYIGEKVRDVPIRRRYY